MQITCTIHVNNHRLLMNQQFKLLEIAVTSKWKDIKVWLTSPMMPCLVRGPANSCHGMLHTCFTNAWAMLLPGSQGPMRLRLGCQGKESGTLRPLAERCPPSPAAF